MLLVVAPPSLVIPGLVAGLPGWFTGLVVLLAPGVWMSSRCHRRLGHWRRYFANWRSRSWWAIQLGSIGLTLATVALLGALPAWDRAWHSWDTAAFTAYPPDPQVLQWLDQAHGQVMLLWQACSAVVLIASLATLALGMIFFWRHFLSRRRVPQPSTDWKMLPSEF